MTITIAQARTSLAEAVETLTGLRCHPYAIVSDPPCAFVDRREMDPRMVFSDDTGTYQLRVTVIVGEQDTIVAQKDLDELCETTGSRSVRAAIQTSSAWTVSLDYASVTLIGAPYGREIGGVRYVAVDFDVEVVF